MPKHSATDRPLRLDTQAPGSTEAAQHAGTQIAQLISGKDQLRRFLPAIQQLRAACGQGNDVTTDPNYFIATSTRENVRAGAVLFYSGPMLAACVYLIEHCRLGVGVGIWRGGNPAGDGLIVAPPSLRVSYVYMAAQVVLDRRRSFCVGLTVKAPLEQSIQVIGPPGSLRVFAGKTMAHRLLLQPTYPAMLAAMGPRTRRSLAGKRKQLEENAGVEFLPSLAPALALEAMLALRTRSLPERSAGFHHARYHLLVENRNFFAMGLRLPNGQWVSLLTGWRLQRTTFIDLQMNDRSLKKESISAVMRAFMLEHEILRKQQLVEFVGGTSLLLRRYCEAGDAATDVVLWRRCARAALFQKATAHIGRESLYQTVREAGVVAGEC